MAVNTKWRWLLKLHHFDDEKDYVVGMIYSTKLFDTPEDAEKDAETTPVNVCCMVEETVIAVTPGSDRLNGLDQRCVYSPG